jgi:hypothetical protein
MPPYDEYEMLIYLAVPVAPMLALTGAMAWFKSRLGDPGD